eukprot:356154-Chlamydomonas_euryale.AAC.4
MCPHPLVRPSASRRQQRGTEDLELAVALAAKRLRAQRPRPSRSVRLPRVVVDAVFRRPCFKTLLLPMPRAECDLARFCFWGKGPEHATNCSLARLHL